MRVAEGRAPAAKALVDIVVDHPDHRAVLNRSVGIIVVISLLAGREASAAAPTAAGVRDAKNDPIASPKATVMGVAPFGPASLTADLRARLESAAAKGLVASGATVTSPAEVSRGMSATSTGLCTEPVCLKRLADATTTPLWLRGSCTIDGSTYRIHLELFDAVADAVVGARDDTCEICTESEVADTVDIAASTLRRTWKLSPKTVATGTGIAGTATAPTNPAGAAPTAATKESAGSRPSMWRRVAPFLAFGGAAAATGLGVYFVYQNDRLANYDSNMNRYTKRLDTKGLAIASFGAAAALLGTGIVLLVLPGTASAPNGAEGRADSGPARQAHRISAVALGFTGSTLELSGAF